MAGSNVTKDRRNREQEVLEAATRIFWRKGYSGASVQDVADAVGVLKGSLYHYISSKDELLFRIFDDSHRAASVVMEEVAALDVEPIPRLHAYIEKFVLFYTSNIERIGLYFRDWKFLPSDRAKIVLEQRRTYDDFLAGILREARDRGDVADTVDPKLAAFFILAAVNGLADWYRVEGRESPQTIARRYADMAVLSVGASLPRS